jgi:multisubunit Na+/H+ antiporter MnhG subunit
VVEILGLIGFGAFLAASGTVGIRLLALAHRTRRLPELAVGLQLVLAGALGYGLLLAAESLHAFPDPYGRWASFAGVTAISVGSWFLALFTRRVFRPESALAHLALLALALWLCVGVYGSWMLQIEGLETGVGGWLGHWAAMLGLFASYTWACFEPFRHHALLRRRARIGIDTGHAIVANRMLLWGTGNGAVAALTLVHLVAQLEGHYELPPSLVGVVSLLALVAAIAQWLAFFPPRAYRKRFVRA